jgi:ABC-type nitrate/sulfonate/bicarbonate transport system substrate-binding protein/outer membrane protein OmpA-like peptidoglycan-associated protein
MVFAVLFMVNDADAVQYIGAPPMVEVVNVPVGDVAAGQKELKVITWGGDIATVFANGNSRQTQKGSIFDKKGLSYKIVREDVWSNQVRDYVSGKTPFLRGTMGMLNMASEVTNRDPRTKMVVIYQETFSIGGDCVVVKPGINSIADLKGKTVVLQAYGPHVDYFTTLLANANMKMSDVNVKWVKDLTEADNTPMEAFYDDDVDAAFVIITDGLDLTSNGAVGTGAEESVKGAKILMSTKSAPTIIADVYAVRQDYFDSHKEEMKKLVHALMLADQELAGIMNNKQQNIGEYSKTMKASADILFGDPNLVSLPEGLYADCTFVGFRGNVKFFSGQGTTRNFETLTKEVQTDFVGLGILKSINTFPHAMWNYDDFRAGLVGIDDVEAPRFNRAAVQQLVAKKQAMGTLDGGKAFKMEIYFAPNQVDFSANQYKAEFDAAIQKAETFSGALLIVEGHSDPMGYYQKKKGNAKKGIASAPGVVLKRIEQSLKNQSVERSHKVVAELIKYAESRGITLDKSQFSPQGLGMDKPKYWPPKNSDEWASNRRVEFSIVPVEDAEALEFDPTSF